MHKTAREALELIDELLARAGELVPSVEAIVAPPFTALPAVADRLQGQNRLKLGAQTMHWEDQGPYTGEISAPMLEEFGVSYVILGHSERRAFCGETNEYVQKKTRTALAHGITPIVAVGETLEEKNAGDTKHKVVTQTRAALHDLTDEEVRRVIIAYEPIWAIGTGQNDDPGNANETMGVIRAAHPALAEVPLLYGGSVKPENMAAYAAQSNINGALVGGASLVASSFIAIVSAAQPARA